jgi:hypothetical protein
LEDGTLVEIAVDSGDAQPISGKLAERVHAAFENIHPIIINACRPILHACRDMRQTVNVEQAEIELGFAFEGEGNIYITKAKASANLTVRFVLKPPT